MSRIRDEIDANYEAFFKDWTAALAGNIDFLEKNRVFVESYRRLSVLQAIKAHIVVPHYTEESAGFYFEAHNDALVSHVSASSGAWRSALQSLRSCIENMLCAVFYNEHPVERELWSTGQFLIGFTDLIKYFEKHPRLSGLSDSVKGIGVIRSEYATLSKAVHASADNFRMTDAAANVLLWSGDNRKASQWATREKKALRGLCLLMISRHRDLLQGTKLTPLRDVLGFSVSSADKRTFKALGVNIA